MSSPKIDFVDSEAHQCEISYCIEKNEKSYVLERKYAKNDQKRQKTAKNGQNSKFWKFLAALFVHIPTFFLLILTYIWYGNDMGWSKF